MRVRFFSDDPSCPPASDDHDKGRPASDEEEGKRPRPPANSAPATGPGSTPPLPGPEHDLYGLLGVRPAATLAEVQKAYRRQCVLHHPDKGGDRHKFDAISRAHEVLTDLDLRRAYDAAGSQGAEELRQGKQTILASIESILSFLESSPAAAPRPDLWRHCLSEIADVAAGDPDAAAWFLRARVPVRLGALHRQVASANWPVEERYRVLRAFMKCMRVLCCGSYGRGHHQVQASAASKGLALVSLADDAADAPGTPLEQSLKLDDAALDGAMDYFLRALLGDGSSNSLHRGGSRGSHLTCEAFAGLGTLLRVAAARKACDVADTTSQDDMSQKTKALALNTSAEEGSAEMAEAAAACLLVKAVRCNSNDTPADPGELASRLRTAVPLPCVEDATWGAALLRQAVQLLRLEEAQEAKTAGGVSDAAFAAASQGGA